MSDAAPRSQRQRWLGHLGTVVLMLVVFFGVQAWQTRTKTWPCTCGPSGDRFAKPPKLPCRR